MSASPRRCCPPRSARATATAARAASKPPRFPARKTPEEFDFTFQRSVKKTVIEPGTGKTHIATALGVRACLAGQRVQFATATQWVARLADAKRQGQLETELRRLVVRAAPGRR